MRAQCRHAAELPAAELGLGVALSIRCLSPPLGLPPALQALGSRLLLQKAHANCMQGAVRIPGAAPLITLCPGLR